MPFPMLAALAFLAPQKTEYKIEKVKDGIHRFTAGAYKSVFWVAKEGIAVIDPINPNAARYLRSELSRRFPGQPIRYVAYSHSHYDHAYGGEGLDGPGVTFIAHQLAREDLVRTKATTRIPDVAFADELAIHLDDETLRLRYYGPNNGRGSVAAVFEKARVLFVVDWIVLGRMPWKDLQGYDIEGMIRSTKEVLLRDDWDIFVGGHAEMGDRAAVRRYLAYLEALYAAVRDGMLAGKSLETLKREIRLDAFRDIPMYSDWLPYNVEGVYNTLHDQSYIRPDKPNRRGANGS